MEDGSTLIEEARGAARSIRRQRGRRIAGGAHALVAISLAGILAVMVNVLARRYYMRWDLSWRGYYRLSAKTVSLLESLDTKVTVAAFIQRSHPLREDIVNLLQEYEYAADAIPALGMTVRVVDPDRELAWTRELAVQYDVREPNVIVVECEGRRKYVEAAELMDYDYNVSLERGVEKKPKAFKAEQIFSSAIQSVTQSARPAVYFLTGHGERAVDDYGRMSGYSSLAYLIGRDNMRVETLSLPAAGRVPADCSALVIAGPDRRIARAEADLIADYLDRSGRLFLLADPALTTGLEELLERWGVALGPHVVVGQTLTGRELVVTAYGDHPITRRLKSVMTMFYMPRSILPLAPDTDAAKRSADRPHVTALAACERDRGWGEADLAQSPPRFDEGADLPGPVPVAVAVERGPGTSIDVQIKPTRMVIVGDSDFVSNGALSSAAGGNSDLFLCALNWLVEREELMAVAPKTPAVLRLDMDRDRMRDTFLLIVAVPGAVAALIGAAVWRRRRY
ncbi:MAG: hypothetical protein FJ225_06410 [Lentisphaerae bacterium]|nr:hypothetical protein [Lentisphaerota bacterium]